MRRWRKMPTRLCWVSEELWADREVVLAAVAQDAEAFCWASLLYADPFLIRFASRTRPQKLWTLLTHRFLVVLFVKKLQRRVEARDRERLEAAWVEHRDELTVGVAEGVAKVIFQHGWVAGCKRQRVA